MDISVDIIRSRKLRLQRTIIIRLIDVIDIAGCKLGVNDFVKYIDKVYSGAKFCIFGKKFTFPDFEKKRRFSILSVRIFLCYYVMFYGYHCSRRRYIFMWVYLSILLPYFSKTIITCDSPTQY